MLIPLSSDPFVHMARTNKTYGFTIAVKELKETVPNIFRYASAYKRNNNLTSKGLWEMFIEPPPEDAAPSKESKKHKESLPEEILNTEPGHGVLPDIDPEAMNGETYNMCHFWSNFEIARLDWFRSKEYEEFFQMMDRSGGFWMERVSEVFWCLCTRSDQSDFDSGAMRRSTPSLPAPCSAPKIYTTSEILDIGTPPSSIALPMQWLASFRVPSTWR